MEVLIYPQLPLDPTLDHRLRHTIQDRSSSGRFQTDPLTRPFPVILDMECHPGKLDNTLRSRIHDLEACLPRSALQLTPNKCLHTDLLAAIPTSRPTIHHRLTQITVHALRIHRQKSHRTGPWLTDYQVPKV